jgi:DNA polymerase-3 subunit epsilon/ATP-dependent DNA helicase DinG
MYEHTMVAIDVEATGLNHIEDEVIEVAAVRFRGTQELEHYTTLIKPSAEIPFKISRLTGITNEMVSDAPSFADIRPALKAFIGDDPVLGHSVEYDVRMLAGSGMRLKQASIDTFELASLIVPTVGSFKLGELIRRLDVQLDTVGDAHRALYDARMAHRLFVRLYEILCSRDMALVEEVVRITKFMPQWSLQPIFSQALSDIAKTSFGRPILPRVTRSLDEYQILEPTESNIPIGAATIDRVFATDGVLGRLFDGYEQRDPQVAMAQAVAKAFNESHHVVVEAGTGTGKGMAYLVPAALHALERGQRVVVSTHTINLQDQLFFKDIPALTRTFDADRADGNTNIPDVPLQYALLKGRSNYLCMRRLEDVKASVGANDDETRAVLKIATWATQTRAGDRNEISLFDKEQLIWDRCHAAFEMCNGPGCAYFNECWFFHARKQAEAAHIVVVNHALLLADMVSEMPVLPAYDHVVIDEAHNLEEVATDQFGWACTATDIEEFYNGLIHEGGSNQPEGLLSRFPTFLKGSTAGPEVYERFSRIVQAISPSIERARVHTKELYDALYRVLTREAEESNYDTRLRITAATRRSQAWQSIAPIWQNVEDTYTSISKHLLDITGIVDNLAAANVADYEVLVSAFKRLQRFSVEFPIQCGNFISGSEPNLITWMVYERQREVLRLAINPLEVATLLRENLFDAKSAVVLTSATLSVNGRFDYVMGRLGADTEYRHQLESPFDYESQALLYVPQDMPEPKDFDYQRTLEDAIVATAIAAVGRTLVLFTATSALRATYTAVQERLNEHDINLIGQSLDGSRKAILERFKSEPRSVLFGTSSFWEGVDVVGDALSALIITKLPFSVPTDPVYAARSEQFTDAFNEYSLPQSILKFKQGFGRLVRGKSDHGMVIVLDRRVLSKKYGQQFLASLPPTTVRTGPVRAIGSLVKRTLRPAPEPSAE